MARRLTFGEVATIAAQQGYQLERTTHKGKYYLVRLVCPPHPADKALTLKEINDFLADDYEKNRGYLW